VKRWLTAGHVALALALPARADAFCRTTTCRVPEECPVDDKGCPATGNPLVWSRPMPLVFRLHARGSALLVNEEARAAVRAAFFRWTDVECPGGRTSLRFVEQEAINDDKPLESDAPRPTTGFGIYFRDHGWPYTNRGGDGQIALTTLEFGKDSGRILYADIELNTGDQELSTTETGTGTDLQTVVTHEVGHYIGLAHSQAPNAIMAASLCASGDRCNLNKVAARRLGDDDRAGVCALFPPGAAPKAETRCTDGGGCATSPAPRFLKLGAAASVLLLALAVRRWRRPTHRDKVLADP